MTAAVAWCVVAAALAMALAPLGTTALYGVAAVTVVAVVGYVLRDELRGPLAATSDRVVRVIGGGAPPTPAGPTAGPRSGPRAALLAVACGLGAAGLAWLLARQGTLGLVAVVAVVLAGLAVAAFWPLLANLMTGSATGTFRRAPTGDASRPGRPAGPRRSRRSEAAAVVVVGAAGAALAWLAASMGTKGVLVVVAAVGATALLTAVRDRTVFFTFATVASLSFLLHKSIGPQDLEVSGGAISVYVTTFDVMLVLLYALWAREGTLVADLRAAVREPVLWLPPAAVLLMLPSLLVAPTPVLSAAELVRMAWMYLLFVYVAVRVRTRRQVWAILAGLAVFVAVQLVVVVLQWRTGGVLGLSFLGVPTELGERVTDTGALGRPFGTVIHPVFLGASLGIITMVALALAVELRHVLARLTALGVVGASVVCLWLANTRASLVALGAAGLVVVAVGVRRGWVTWPVLGRIGLGLGAFVLVFFDQISRKFAESFRTGHYLKEVESRLELNDIALVMFDDHPVVGVGLNNFEVVLPRYEANPVIFFGHPVHNLYLLVLAETGVIGLVGFLGLAVGLGVVAFRLARSADVLFRPLGVGIAGAMGFLALEELLGFSLRQDIPLALFWLLAGLAVAGARMTGMSPWPDHWAVTRRAAPRGAERRRRPARAMSALGALAVVALVATTGGGSTAEAAGSPVADARAATAVSVPVAAGAGGADITFSAVDRATGQQGIYTVRSDGTGIQRLTPADGRYYSWPRWAFGNTKIVYTVRTGAPGSPESIAMMNPDGSGVQVLASFDFRVAQPVVEPGGRWLAFTATAPWFPEVAIFRLDLATLESTNLTARTMPLGGFDSDPALDPAGEEVVFVWHDGTGGAAVTRMDADGTDRRRITGTQWFDTDPALSADGTLVAIASYRGEGTPSAGGGPGGVKVADWRVVVQPAAGGPETVLTDGMDCTTRAPDDPCGVAEMSGFVPEFVPGGTAVSFVGALDSMHTAICAIGLDGSDPRVVLASADLAIDWYDWVQAPGASTSTAHVGSQERSSRLLLVTADRTGHRSVVTASTDLMHRTEVALPDGVEPLEARWAPDGETILLTAAVAVGDSRAPHPAPPAGRERRAHVTLEDLDLLAVAQREERLAGLAPDTAQRQVFLVAPGGALTQVTDPWIEDWRDGLAPGDARGNEDPVMTPDGRFLVVTNTSTLTGESVLLRIDLRTGDVLNLTNGSAGALPTDDSEPAVSPDGTQIAFSWTQGSLRGVYRTDTADGVHVSPITTGNLATGGAAWTPDGASIVYVEDRDGVPTVVLAPLRPDGTAGAATVLSPQGTPAWRPVAAPEGDRVAFLGPAATGVGLFVADPGGRGGPREVQPDPTNTVLDVDWGRGVR